MQLKITSRLSITVWLINAVIHFPGTSWPIFYLFSKRIADLLNLLNIIYAACPLYIQITQADCRTSFKGQFFPDILDSQRLCWLCCLLCWSGWNIIDPRCNVTDKDRPWLGCQTIRWDNFDKLLSLTAVSVTVMPVMNEDNGDNDGPAKRSLITDQMIADISTTSSQLLNQFEQMTILYLWLWLWQSYYNQQLRAPWATNW